MEILKLILYIIIVYLVHSFYLKYRKIHDKELKGPNPIPILGNFHQLSGLPHRDLTKLGKKYGKLFRVWFADEYVVIVNGISVMKEIYVDHAENFLDRPRYPTLEHMKNYKGTVSSNGENWKRNRDLVNRSMRKLNLKYAYDTFDSRVERLIKKMKQLEQSGQLFDVHHYFYELTVYSTYNIAFNKEIDEKEVLFLMETIDNIFITSGTGNIFDHLSIGKPLFRLWKSKDKNCSNLIEYLSVKVNDHVNAPDYNPNESNCIVDHTINEYGTENHNDFYWVLATISDTFLGGTDSVSLAILKMVLNLINHPDIQEKLYSMIKETIGCERNSVVLSDRKQLPYVTAFIKESMRYTPGAPFNGPRIAKNDCFISGHFIPKGSTIFVNFHAISEDEDVYQNPREFNPDRFMGDKKVEPFPVFSTGPRNCPGQSFALDLVFVVITNVILNFKLKSPDGKRIDDTENNEIFGLTLKTKVPIFASLEKRL